MRISDWSSDVCSSDLVLEGSDLPSSLFFEALSQPSTDATVLLRKPTSVACAIAPAVTPKARKIPTMMDSHPFIVEHLASRGLERKRRIPYSCRFTYEQC